MKKLLDILLSLKTAFMLFALSIAVCLMGSLMLPQDLAFFSGIDDTPLFRWLAEAGSLHITWWIYALVGVIGLLALSTVLCTLDALYRIRAARGRLVARLSPQVMHLGVLFVMLGHLLTAAYGVREDVTVASGGEAGIEGGYTISVSDVRALKDEAGYDVSWEADLAVAMNGQNVAGGTLRPCEPIYVSGAGLAPIGLYFKSITISEGEVSSALVRVCRDPGAIWALIGGMLVVIGGAGFVYGKAGQS